MDLMALSYLERGLARQKDHSRLCWLGSELLLSYASPMNCLSYRDAN